MSAAAPDTSVPQSSTQKSVFFTGATGYIGGAVLTKLLESANPPSSITVLLRDPKKAELLKELSFPKGVTVVPLIGSLSDTDKIIKAAESHDITIHCADADSLEAANAIIQGQANRRKATGHRPLLIHTTGTGVLVDGAQGQYPSDKLWTDLYTVPATSKSDAIQSIDEIPDSALHREIDLAILNADAAGKLKAYLIYPSMIWGEAVGELFTKGFSNSYGVFIPVYSKAAIKRGRAGIIGKGANIWNHVNIADVAELYRIVYAGALRGDIGHGRSGYYFAAAGDFTYLAASQAIGAALVNAGLAKESQPTPYTPEEITEYLGGDGAALVFGSNSRGVADRSKSIGWRPKRTSTQGFLEDAAKEFERVRKSLA